MTGVAELPGFRAQALCHRAVLQASAAGAQGSSGGDNFCEGGGTQSRSWERQTGGRKEVNGGENTEWRGPARGHMWPCSEARFVHGA